MIAAVEIAVRHRTQMAAPGEVVDNAQGTVSFGTGWLFGPATAGSSLPGFDDSALAPVTLPHTVAPVSWQNWDSSAWERL